MTQHTVTDYKILNQQAESLTSGESNLVANLANISALLFDQISNLNWCGFYMMDNGELVLGPFQGKHACIRIPLSRGVCGTAAATNEIQRIADVHAFDGHIACDAASESEIVLPISMNGVVVAVLDIDSPQLSRFSDEDEQGLSELVKSVIEPLFKRATSATLKV
ncbi:GAF domain-containing protein [Echinimonas agarilytica]|uniref:GAF domain-containing protein n=1 Tax=Echinimonas agarilytica TaxID=1215918 RepID=A0AA41W9N0_9GAMM|nr:GAF domain-containing protein [Echinimonas agarilytica]MCM2681152.1 GAF domain-containing protein [Echinimonas agarilytica]